ncbi:ISKra4 family transposase [Leptolyngbyaceae cyanobacterium CCMR0082]|uniref:ISKra4 family transposase n=1 Tax=Adonisia turfae CCMR0082 TaxID=2304604 RepID=A0A6M0SDJ7_9CYAN|nr:ISKra4 family transposase [Adonisia turfae]NEZ66406.1 ISKra4 family transposase [Adonisia turfae CCMR0082]NEZ68398.1 ISKra4 family transposase [Adonisia turfae CCMR0082]
MTSTLEHQTFEQAYEQYQELIKTLSSEDAQDWEHGEIERYIHEHGTELLRRLLQGHLDLRYQQEVYQSDVYGTDGEKRPHRRKRTHRQLETLFGGVVVPRVGYSTQTPNVSALYPSDGKLNLSPDKYSDELRRRVAEEASKVSFSETSQTIANTTGGQVGKRQCEEVTVSVAQDFEDFYIQRSGTETAAADDLLVLTTDSKGIVMHPDDLREATAKAAQQSAQSHQTRLSPGQKRNRKRMAMVASVYHVPPYSRQPDDIIGDQRDPPKRPSISDKRVWASVRQDAKSMIASAFDEAISRDPEHQRTWVVLVDGELHQLNTIKATAKQHSVAVTIVIDFIHVLEYVWKAALCFHASGSEEADRWVQARALRILNGQASDVAAGIRRSATLQKLSKKKRENADKCADYLLKYRPFLRYDQYLEQGYPIASGVIEGACRHLVNDRMAITGARWRLDRAEAVLRIRALRASDDFDEYWAFHKLQEFKRNHVSKFQDPERLLAA